MRIDIKGHESFAIESIINQELKNILENKSRLEVGIFEDAKYDDGKPVASIAKLHEFGNLRVPPRPFFSIAIDKNQGKWGGILKNQFLTNQNAELSLSQVGEVVRGDVALSLTTLKSPPNAETTIKKKESSNPLIDTGFLRACINFKVAKKG